LAVGGAPDGCCIESIGVVGVIFVTILVASSTSVVASVSPSPKTRLRLENAISTCCFTPGRLALAPPLTKRSPHSASVSSSSALR